MRGIEQQDFLGIRPETWCWDSLSEEERTEQGNWLSSLGVGKKYIPYTMMRINLDPRHLNLLTNFCDLVYRRIKSGPGLYIYGVPGTGKTTLLRVLAGAVWFFAVRRMVQQGDENLRWNGFSVVWWNAADMFRAIGSFKDEADSEQKRLREADVLFVDDFGSQERTRIADPRFEALMEHRYNNLKLTCFSSNWPVERVMKEYPRFGDRLRDPAWMRSFPVTGYTQRRGSV